MPPQPLTRITILLPFPTTLEQYFVVNDVVESLAKFSGGVTSSLESEPQFRGSWYDEEDEEIKGDLNLLLFSDAPLAVNSELISYLEELKLDCQYRLQEKIIWITLHNVDRIVEGDYQI